MPGWSTSRGPRTGGRAARRSVASSAVREGPSSRGASHQHPILVEVPIDLRLAHAEFGQAVLVAVTGREVGEAAPGGGIAGLERDQPLECRARAARCRRGARRAVRSSRRARPARAQIAAIRDAAVTSFVGPAGGQRPGQAAPQHVRIRRPAGFAALEQLIGLVDLAGAACQVGRAEPDPIVVGRLLRHAIEGLAHGQQREGLRFELPVQAEQAGLVGRRSANAARSAAAIARMRPV